MSLFTSMTSLFGRGTCTASKSEPRQPAASKHKPTVLIIDDDASFLQMMQTVLGRAGYGVLTSNTGPKGLDMLRYSPRDVSVVVLDFKMPRYDGAETLKQLRRLKCPVKVIGISGITSNQIPDTFQQGVERLVVKPFEPGELLQTIESLVSGNSEAASAAPVPA